MINKIKTIKKAIAKYDNIFPMRRKVSLEDSFFCLRGEYYLVFKTKDKKIHAMKACEERQIRTIPKSGGKSFKSIFKFLNKPIIIWSFFVKKPVKTYLINLFPFPSITWSVIDDTDSILPPLNSPSPERPLQHHPATTGVELTSPAEMAGVYPAIKQRSAEQQPRFTKAPRQGPHFTKSIRQHLRFTEVLRQQPRLTGTSRQQPAAKKSTYHLEVIAPGRFPVIIDREMFIADTRVAPVNKAVSKTVVPRPFAWPLYDEH